MSTSTPAAEPDGEQPGGQDGDGDVGVEGFSAADTSDIDRLSYEQARAELVETVAGLETGGAGLEESLALWERGEALADRCEAWLAGARQKLDDVRARTHAGSPGEDG